MRYQELETSIVTVFFNKVILALCMLAGALSVFSFAAHAEYHAWVEPSEFDEARNFPLNKRVCRAGECTMAGLKRQQIVLTFDDGPVPAKTRAVLAVLERFGVKGTFYFHSIQAERNSHILDEIYRAGHKLANHGYKQTPIDRSTDGATVIRYLMHTHLFLERYMSSDDIFTYRNPGGYWAADRARMLNRHSVLRQYVGPIYWNVGGWVQYKNGQIADAADWQCQSDLRRGRPRYVRGWSNKAQLAAICANGYYRKVLRNYQANRGSIVLMHDIHEISALILERLLTKMREDAVEWEFIFVQDIPAVQNMRLSL